VLDVAMDWLVMCSGWIFVRLSTRHSLTHSLDHEEAKSCLNARQRHQAICTCSTLLVTEAFADTQNLVCEMIFCIPVMGHCLLLKLLQRPKILYVKWYSTYCSDDSSYSGIKTCSLFLLMKIPFICEEWYSPETYN